MMRPRFIGVGLLFSLVSTLSAAAQVPAKPSTPAAPKNNTVLPVKRPAPIPPPDDKPGPGEEGIAPYVFTLDQSIQFFEQRVKANPTDFMSYRQLGEFFERKGRERGDLAAYAKAEAALRKADELFSDDPRTRASLAAVLATRHKFAEALKISRELYRNNPSDIDALATMGDALAEIGQYAEAEATFRKLEKLAAIPAVIARLANLAEAKGEVEEAERLMRSALEAIQKTGKPTDAAWYFARLGDIAFTVGRIDDAEKAYKAVVPGIDSYHDATFGLARVEAARGRLDRAVELAKKAVAIGPDPHMLAFLSDLYVLSGKPEASKPLLAKIDEETRGKSEYLRARAMYLADNDRDLPEALKLAQEDFAQRQDVFGYDTLAWALYRNGKLEEAAKVGADALKLGTKDARLFYHLGMIHLKLGNRESAKRELSRALELNPHFGLTQPEIARKALASLRDVEPK